MYYKRTTSVLTGIVLAIAATSVFAHHGWRGYQEVIETEDGVFDLSLEWPGGPQDFSLQDARGMLRLDVNEGKFPQAPGGAAGALRVVSILNLAEIVQRLSLSQMFESGIPFNSMEGEVVFHGGTI